MAVAVKPPAQQSDKPKLTPLQVAEWVEEEIAKGQGTHDACKAVLTKRIYPQRLERALLDIIGVHALYNLWQLRIQQPRRAAPMTEEEDDEAASENGLPLLATPRLTVEPATENNIPKGGIFDRVPASSQNGQWQSSSKRSMLEGRYPIHRNGARVWVRLGDMTHEECREVEEYYQRQLSFYGVKRAFFGKLAEETAATPTIKIQEKYEERDLIRLYDACRDGT